MFDRDYDLYSTGLHISSTCPVEVSGLKKFRKIYHFLLSNNSLLLMGEGQKHDWRGIMNKLRCSLRAAIPQVDEGVSHL